MKKNTHYLFKAALAGIALSGMPGVGGHVANAAPITNADFTFESQIYSVYGTVSNTSVSWLADVGTGTLYGYHTGTATDWNLPTGQGSGNSFAGYDWSVNDYWEFKVPTTGIQNILLSFDTISSASASGAGPSVFELAYSTDGTNFSSYATYSVLHSTSGTAGGVTYTGTYDGTVAASAGSTHTETNWVSNFNMSAFNVSFNITDPNLANDPNAAFELIAESVANTSATNRLDNFIVSGTAVPEPATVGLLSMASVALLMRRRQK